MEGPPVDAEQMDCEEGDLEDEETHRVDPARVIVHGAGNEAQVMQTLRDIAGASIRGAKVAAAARRGGPPGSSTERGPSSHQFLGLMQRLDEDLARPVLRKLFLWKGSCNVVQEIWIQDKQNPAAKDNPLKEYVVVHVHHHAQVERVEDCRVEHTTVVDAVNARHLANGGGANQADNPFFDTFIEKSGGNTLKLYPRQDWGDWECNVCCQGNPAQVLECRSPPRFCSQQPSDWKCAKCPKCKIPASQPLCATSGCKGKRPKKWKCVRCGANKDWKAKKCWIFCTGTSPCTRWTWKTDDSNLHDSTIRKILAKAEEAEFWLSKGKKTQWRGDGTEGEEVGFALSDLLSRYIRHAVEPAAAQIHSTGTTGLVSEEIVPGIAAASEQPRPPIAAFVAGSESQFGTSAPKDCPPKPVVLFLGMNVDGHPQLRVGDEYKGLREALQKALGSGWRDRVEIEHQFFSSPDDLVKEVTEYRPTALHIACHGQDQGLHFQDAFVKKGGLAAAIKAANALALEKGEPIIRIVIANACFSKELAYELGGFVEFAVGYEGGLRDKEAIGFSRTLYEQMGSGNSLLQSFEAARMSESRRPYALVGVQSDPDKMRMFSHQSRPAMGMIEAKQRKNIKINVSGFLPEHHWCRDELMVVLQAWLDDKRRSALAVYGLGGSGKSTLARHFLSEVCQNGGFDVVAFLRADRLKEDYEQIAVKLGGRAMDDVQSMKAMDLRGYVHSLLEDGDCLWLIAIDDAPHGDNLTEEEQMLRGYPWNEGKTLVTSRSQEWDWDGRGVSVGSYGEEEAVEFASSRVLGWKGRREEVRQLVRKLECFPLAISQALDYCKEAKVAPLEYLDEMNGDDVRVWAEEQRVRHQKEMKDKKESDKYPYSFVEVMRMSMKKLEETEPDGAGAAYSVLRKLAYLNPSTIPVELFSRLERRRIGLLQGQSLVVEAAPESNTSEGSYGSRVISAHALTQEVVRNYLMGSSKIDTVCQLVKALNGKIRKMKMFEKGERETFSVGWTYCAHIEKLVGVLIADGDLGRSTQQEEWSDETVEMLASVCRMCGYFLERIACLYGPALKMQEASLKLLNCQFQDPLRADLATTYGSMGIVFYAQGLYDKALEYHRKCLKIQLKVLGGDHASVAGTYANMGSVFRAQGLHDKALEYHQKCLKILLKVLGGDHADVAATYNDMGCVFDAQGLHDKALEYHQKCLEIQLKVLGGEHASVAATYSNMGSVFRAQGLYDKALEYHQKCLEILLKVLGGDHASVAATYSNMGSVFHAQGQYDKALEYFQRCLEIRLKVLGGDHADVAGTYNDMGCVFHAQGQYDKALEYHRKCLKIQLKVLGGDHPDVAATYNNMGNVFCQQGLYDKALEYHRKCLEIELKVLGGKHASVARAYANMGSVFCAQDQYKEALEYYQRCLKIQLEVLGGEHADVAVTYANMGSVFRAQGLHDKALEYHQKCLEIELKVLGGKHADVARTYRRIGSVFHAQGLHDKALEYHQKCLEIQLKVLGGKHASVAGTYSHMGSVFHAQGLHDKALEYYQRCLKIQLKVLGGEHADVAGTYTNMGCVFDAQGLYGKALEYHRKCLKIQLKVLGGHHASVAATYGNMGSVFHVQGLYDKALEYHRKCLEIELKVLGGEHADVAGTYRNMGSVFLAQGLHDKALKYFQRCLKIQLEVLGGEHADVAGTYANMGSVFRAQGLHDKALEYYRRCLKIQLKVLGGEHADVAATYSNMGNELLKQDLHDKALEHHEKCLKIQLKVFGGDHPDVSLTYTRIDIVKALKDPAIFAMALARSLGVSSYQPRTKCSWGTLRERAIVRWRVRPMALARSFGLLDCTIARSRDRPRALARLLGLRERAVARLRDRATPWTLEQAPAPSPTGATATQGKKRKSREVGGGAWRHRSVGDSAEGTPPVAKRLRKRG